MCNSQSQNKMLRATLRRYPCLIAALSLLFFAASDSAVARDVPQKRVLAFHALRRDSPAAIVDGHIQRVLNDGLGGRLDYYSEYIDVARFPDPEFQKAQLEF